MFRLELIALSLCRRRYALDQLSHVCIPEECLLRPPTLCDLHDKATQVLDGRVERWCQRPERWGHDSVCRTEEGTTLVEAVFGILLRRGEVGGAVDVSRHVCALEKLSSCDQLDIFVVPRVRRLYLCHTAANVRPWGVFVSRFDIHGMQVIEQHVVSG